MNKDQALDLIIKAFGIYLLVLAVMATPKMLEGVVMLGYYLFQRPWGEVMGGESTAFRDMSNTLHATVMFSGLGALFRFVIYLIVAINFLRSGSIVKRLINGKAEQGVVE